MLLSEHFIGFFCLETSYIARPDLASHTKEVNGVDEESGKDDAEVPAKEIVLAVQITFRAPSVHHSSSFSSTHPTLFSHFMPDHRRIIPLVNRPTFESPKLSLEVRCGLLLEPTY